ncbi:hypothetical protein EVAR_4033_1 [Eumeta japonica]|uniref:Uncharacterized protein n=1 Tax=Eumeta variegata TaxID=151549 RepID=A0A4C1T4M2_EUMVA|nr:hypothetical protein EVAR_4033_1 [Eumeta japonica]
MSKAAERATRGVGVGGALWKITTPFQFTVIEISSFGAVGRQPSRPARREAANGTCRFALSVDVAERKKSRRARIGLTPREFRTKLIITIGAAIAWRAPTDLRDLPEQPLKDEPVRSSPNNALFGIFYTVFTVCRVKRMNIVARAVGGRRGQRRQDRRQVGQHHYAVGECSKAPRGRGAAVKRATDWGAVRCRRRGSRFAHASTKRGNPSLSRTFTL